MRNPLDWIGSFWGNGGQDATIEVDTTTGFGAPYPMGQFSREDEYLTRLYGVEKFIKYRQMVKSHGGLAAIQRAYTLPILQADWDVVGGDPEILEFVRPMIMQDIKAHLQQALRCVQYGMYAFEQTFKVVDGKTVEAGIFPRPPWTYWAIAEDPATRKISRIIQLYEATSGYIPENRMVLFVFSPDGESFQGNSLYRPCLMHYEMVMELYKIDAIGNNRHAVGSPAIGLETGANEVDKAAAQDFMENWQTAESAYFLYRTQAVKPENIKVIFNDYKNASTLDSIRHHNQMMFTSALTGFLGIGDQNTGSLAREGAEINFFVDSVTAIADMIAEVETNVRIKRIVDLNYSNVTEYPELRHKNVKRLALSELGTFIQQVGTMLTRTDPIENMLREKLGAPLIEDDETVEGTEVVHGDDDDGNVAQQLSAAKTGKFWRPLTDAESYVRLEAIDEQMDDREEMVSDRLKTVRAAQVENLVRVSKGYIQRKEFAGLQTLDVRFRKEYKAAMMRDVDRDWDKGYSELVGELKRQVTGEKVVEDTIDERQQLAAEIEEVSKQLQKPEVKRRRERQRVIAENVTQNYAEDIANVVLRDFRAAAITAMTDPTLDEDEIIARATEAGETAGGKIISNGATYVATTPIQDGRTVAAEQNADAIETGYYSAILDGNTCDVCDSADGRVLDIDNPYPPAPNPACEGGLSRCRCIHVWVLKGELKVQ